MTCLDPGTIAVCVKKLKETSCMWQPQMCGRFCGYLPTITGGGGAGTGSVAIPLPHLGGASFTDLVARY